jgi:LacI family transcriptional regulator
MEDVARVAGVSKMTVSYALSGKRRISEETREIVLRAAKELNFEPNAIAQQLSSGQNPRSISLYSTYLSVGVDTLIVKRLQSLLQGRGYEVSFNSYGLFSSDPAVQSAAVRSLRRQRPRTIICASSDLPASVVEELHQFIRDGGVVMYYDCPLDLCCDSVLFDHRGSLYDAARHLLERGHRRIGLHILGMATPVEPRFVQEARAGFEQALSEFGITPRKEWFFRGLSYDNHEEGGAQTARQLLQMTDRPTGMCIVNDTAAAAFVVEMHRAGVRVPEDISVVSTDDLPVAQYSLVPLTTVAHPVETVALLIVELLLSRLEEGYEGEARQIIVRGPLVSRNSVRELSLV